MSPAQEPGAFEEAPPDPGARPPRPQRPAPPPTPTPGQPRSWTPRRLLNPRAVLAASQRTESGWAWALVEIRGRHGDPRAGDLSKIPSLGSSPPGWEGSCGDWGEVSVQI